MFCSLLKAKLEIEAKVTELQTTFHNLLSSPVREIKFTSENDSESAKRLLLGKIQEVDSIDREYKAALNQHHQFSAELLEAKETAEEIEVCLDSLFEAFGIEIPEELRQIAREVDQTFDVQQNGHQENQENRRDDSNIYQDQEEEDSDKENSVLNCSQNSSGGYFSPNIQIQKSLVDPNSTNDALYTPAVKSSSKIPFYKRNL